MKIDALIAALGGELAAGSGDLELTAVMATGKATASDLVFAEDEASARKALISKAGAVVLPARLEIALEDAKLAVIRHRQPRLWFARAAELLRPRLEARGVHPQAVVAASAEVAEDVTIEACAVVGEGARIGKGSFIGSGAVIGAGVTVGEECRIHPRAVLYTGTTVGNRVVLHAGAVIGADGFGYVRDNQTGHYTQFPQQGTVVLEDEVEIGANTTIDRGALEQTRIGRGTKIDNLVHVGHNCQIGEDVILVALTGISGSSSVGKGAVIAGQVGIGDHAHVGPGVILGGQAGVLSGKTVTNEGLKPGTVLWGTPARPLMQVLRELAIVGRMAKGSKK